MQSRAFWAIALIALLLRVLTAVTVVHPELRRGTLVPRAEEVTYHGIAATLATTGRYALGPGTPPTAYRGPGFILLLAGLYWLLGPHPIIGMAVNLACGVGVVLMIGLCTQELRCGRTAPFVATGAAALFLPLVEASTGLLTDCAAVLGLLAGLVALLRWRRTGQLGSAIAAGIWVGWSFVIRSSSVFTIVLLVVALAFTRRGLRATAAFCLAVGACLFPWVLRNRLVLGAFLAGTTNTGILLWRSNNLVSAGVVRPNPTPNGEGVRLPRIWLVAKDVPLELIPGHEVDFPSGMSETESDARGYHLLRRFVYQHPAAVIQLIGYKLLRFAFDELMQPPLGWRHLRGTPLPTWHRGPRLLRRGILLVQRWVVVGFGVAGLYRMFRRDPRSARFLLAVVVGTIVMMMATYPLDRFLLPASSVLIIAAACWFAQRQDPTALEVDGPPGAGDVEAR